MTNQKHAFLALVLSVYIGVGCDDQNTIKSTSSVADVSSAQLDSLGIEDGSEDVMPTLGPPCESQSDCSNVFIGLGQCEVALCVPGTGSQSYCKRQSVQNGEPCDDADVCTTADKCTNGQCYGNNPLICDDDRPCTTDSCDSASGCVFEPISDLSCDDGSPCTVDDQCMDGYCVGSQSASDDCICQNDSDCTLSVGPCAGQWSCDTFNKTQGECQLVPAAGVICSQSGTSACVHKVCAKTGENAGQCVDEFILQGECDDGNPCTVGESCKNGVCSGGVYTCAECKVDSDCTKFDDGNLCNGTLRCQEGACRVDLTSITTCPGTEIPCMDNVCQPSTGLCQSVPAADGSACSDGTVCTLDDHCSDGQCVATVSANCGPSSLCILIPDCDPEKGCTQVFTESPCSDGNACTVGDFCQDGECTPGVGTQQCDDGFECTLDKCTPGVGCDPEALDSKCDDGHACTTDWCDKWVGCQHTPDSSQCSDGNPCTNGVCKLQKGCQHFPNTGSCDDGDPCTADDKCSGGKCTPGDKICPCNDDANCTVPGGGDCAGVWHCIANQCVLETTAATPCAPSSAPCTVSFCDMATGNCEVETLPQDTDCDDGNACTVGERCVLGSTGVMSCDLGVTLDCDDGSPCTNDTCVTGSGCAHTNNQQPCDDGDPCTEGDTCKDGTCSAATTICDCKADSDCSQSSNKCEGISVCVDNVCQKDLGSVVDCQVDSLGSCLSATCNPETGECQISKKSDGAPCDDGNLCTVDDVCIAATCISGLLEDCDDTNSCTADSCDVLKGCVNTPIQGPCSDGNTCTTDDQCKNGKCIAATNICLEECDNGLDDDKDGYIDCDDPDCGNFELCDECASAPFIQCDTSGLPGQVIQTGQSSIKSTSCGQYSFSEDIYRFTTTVTGAVTVNLQNGADVVSLVVLVPGQSGTCNGSACKASGSKVVFSAVAGMEYHIVVERKKAFGAAAYTLGVECSPNCEPACNGQACGPDGCGGQCGSCEDGNPCTSHYCASGQCETEVLDDCCQEQSDCVSSQPCLSGACNGGVCQWSTKPGCCTSSLDCDDNIWCTNDACVSNFCVHTPTPGCCTADIDCSEGAPCTKAACLEGSCIYLKEMGCCVADADCDDGVFCTIDTCVDGQCQLLAQPECCTSASDCHDDNDCTHDACDVGTQQCVYEPVPGCCASVNDCMNDANPCTEVDCVAGNCVHQPVLGCCYQDMDCASDDACTAVECISHICIESKKPNCCLDAKECQDGLACTQDECVNNQCVNMLIADCCGADSDCNDTDQCTHDTCVGGVCINGLIAGCCTANSECDDGKPCTLDACETTDETGSGTCSSVAIEGCCSTVSDCNGGTCHKAQCVSGQCQYTAISGCCDIAADCAVANSCLKPSCNEGLCKLESIEGCCLTDAHCPVPNSPCLASACVDNSCVETPIAGCCQSDLECGQLAGQCQTAECLGHACVLTKTPGCCEQDVDCGGNSVPCSTTSCVDNSCKTAFEEGCCATADDCKSSTEPCSVTECVDSVCVSQPMTDCCTSDQDCAASTSGACQIATCVLGECLSVGKKAGCCDTVSDCPVAIESCKQTNCVDHLCVTVPVQGCCTATADCSATADPCLETNCMDGACVVQTVSGCCKEGADCPDDGNSCTETLCEAGVCVSQPEPGCCTNDSQCDALSDGQCTVGRCVSSVCTAVPLAGCCEADSECENDANPCTVSKCVSGHCTYVPTPGCCETSADCPEDSNPCTLGLCKDKKCVWEASDDCCQTALDCPSVADPCVERVCMGGSCLLQSVPECSVGACLYNGFDQSSDPEGWTFETNKPGPGWSVKQNNQLSGGGALYTDIGASKSSGEVNAISPPFKVNGAAQVRFRYRLSVLVGDCEGVKLAVHVGPVNQPDVSVWSTCSGSDKYSDVIIDLSPWAGQDVTVRLSLTPGPFALQGDKVWLDDFAVAGDCALLCESTCQDADDCTTDLCQDGQCVSFPIPGCCQWDQMCEDGDPCTKGSCSGQSGCVSETVPGCLTGSCFGSDFNDGLPEGWSTKSTIDSLSFKPTGALQAPEGLHLQAWAGLDAEGHSTTLSLPPVMSSGTGLALRFALKQTVGTLCELGRLAVVINGQEQFVACGNISKWMMNSFNLDVQQSEFVKIELRFDAKKSGAKVQIDDLRITGACHEVQCQTALDCDDSDMCTLDTCDTAYQCGSSPIQGCCVADEDCGAFSMPCETATCVDGACHFSMEPGCSDGTCWYEGFDEMSSLSDWTISSASDSLGTNAVSWTFDSIDAISAPGSLHGHYSLGATPPKSIPAATVKLPKLVVGSTNASLSFMHLQNANVSDCKQGAVEFWIGSTLVWQHCGNQDSWSKVSVSLSPWVGTVVQPWFRFRVASQANATGDAWIDDVRVTGECTSAQCATTQDCDDNNPCTNDACSEFMCQHTTTQVPCDDGDACTSGDTCHMGDCVSQPLVCYDDEPCTDDQCDPNQGCVFQPNTLPCDDGDPCTAGDTCGGGSCLGAPILCKDFNGCTQDGCTPGQGCLFLPEPYGSKCTDDGALFGMCNQSQCVDWEIAIDSGPATNTQAYAVLNREQPTPIRVVGSHNPEGSLQATLFSIDHKNLSLIHNASFESSQALYDIDDVLAVGSNGITVATSSDLDSPVVKLDPALNLRAVHGVGQTFFLGGDGSAVGDNKSTLLRCKRTGGSWQTCQRMAVVHSMARCGKQVPFHINSIWAASPQNIVVAGGSVEDGNFVARVAVWDGNTVSGCNGLGVYSGQVYYTGEPVTLAVDQMGVHSSELFRAVDGAGSTIWAAGDAGMVYRFDGTNWLKVNPGQWPEALQWNSDHTVHDLVVTEEQLHMVGDGVGVRNQGCRDTFYVHARKYGEQWMFDRLIYFSGALSDCGVAPFQHVGLRGLAIDKLTLDLYVVGWGPDNIMSPSKRQGLVMRLKTP